MTHQHWASLALSFLLYFLSWPLPASANSDRVRPAGREQSLHGMLMNNNPLLPTKDVFNASQEPDIRLNKRETSHICYIVVRKPNSGPSGSENKCFIQPVDKKAVESGLYKGNRCIPDLGFLEWAPDNNIEAIADDLGCSHRPISNAKIELCIHAGFEGGCGWVEAGVGECTNVPAGYENQVSSFHLKGATCRFYRTSDCSGGYFEASGDNSNLATFESGWNDAIGSLRCRDRQEDFRNSGLREVQLCKDVNFKGGCDWVEASLGQCTKVPAGYENQVSSFYLKDTTCYFYRTSNCSGRNIRSTRDNDNLVRFGSNWNDAIGSFHCAR